MTKIVYRHKKISRYLIGRFEFKDHILTLDSDRDDQEFRSLMARQPARESRDIVQTDERALESLQDQLRKRGPRVVRSAQDSGSVPSAVQGSGRALTVEDLSPEVLAKIQAQAYADARKDAELKVQKEMRAEVASKEPDSSEQQKQDTDAKSADDPKKAADDKKIKLNLNLSESKK